MDVGTGQLKYMGSKRRMLENGLGSALEEALSGAERFVDLFAGSAAVSWHVASEYRVEVIANDLQKYSGVLARAVLRRTRPLGNLDGVESWLAASRGEVNADLVLAEWSPDRGVEWSEAAVIASRQRADSLASDQSISKAYGGHYFSLWQAAAIDAMLAALPTSPPRLRDICHAAVISASSRCAAAPGHTAQPFRPVGGGLRGIQEAWSRDVIALAWREAKFFAARHALLAGRVAAADAVGLTRRLRPTDLVFIDPPYSAVQYSRFYHVLESVASLGASQVSGRGRYPELHLRPQSKFSLKSSAQSEFRRLLAGVSAAGASAIVTFPEGTASNGMSGESVIAAADEFFCVDEVRVSTRFSTLGGTGGVGRAARKSTRELILTLKPV